MTGSERAPRAGARTAVRAGLDVEAGLAAPFLAADGTDRVLVAGMDEVGRGALAGPVVVGVCAAWLPAEGEIPAVRDSKALTDRRRRALVPEIRAWAAAVALGEANPAEIDALGISAALGLAGRRAWAAVCAAAGQEPVALVLDGRDDWLTRSDPDAGPAPAPRPVPPVPTMLVKAEDRCATVAAASIAAKVARDDTMIALHADHPAYGWAGNKGYGAAAHRAAILDHGAGEHHRRSWSLGLPAAPADEPPTLFD
ncbi:ribonuclease HII [Micrococcus endophyticus]|uniref:ribonuclease HII n=1 Tax=Micrococcus endophyticus TaxID=455343 RepID=UPI0038296B7D